MPTVPVHGQEKPYSRNGTSLAGLTSPCFSLLVTSEGTHQGHIVFGREGVKRRETGVTHTHTQRTNYFYCQASGPLTTEREREGEGGGARARTHTHTHTHTHTAKQLTHTFRPLGMTNIP